MSARSLSLSRGGRELFESLSFEVTSGQLVQIEGANGAGKTSLLRILAGLSRYGFEGAIECAVPPLYLGHKSAVKSMLTPRENLALHVSGEQFDDHAIEATLAQVGLYGYEDVPSHTLSAGQHRRVNLARLYLSSAALCLLDEPFTAIDREGVAELELLLVKHVTNGGAAIITSHQPLSVDYHVNLLNLVAGMRQ